MNNDVILRDLFNVIKNIEECKIDLVNLYCSLKNDKGD